MAVSTPSLATLPRVPSHAQPKIRPGTVPAGIVHIGLGTFHRAYQAELAADPVVRELVVDRTAVLSRDGVKGVVAALR